MVSTGSSTLKRNLGLAIILASTATGCTSVEYTSQAELSAVQTVMPLPKPGTELAYAVNPADPTASVAMIANPTTTTTTTAAPNVSEQVANATVAASAEYASAPTMLQPATGTQPMAVSYAEMPLTAEVLAIQSVVPTPKPAGVASSNQQLAYAATATPMDSLSAFDTRPPVVIQQPDTLAAPLAQGPLRQLISKYSKLYDVPEALVHRVVKRESGYNPRAYSRGNYGLMQIRYNTAKGLGYTGTPAGLFDAETNLKYAVKYLRGAWMVADTDHDGAVRLYARGYYYDAKRKGLLNQMQ